MSSQPEKSELRAYGMNARRALLPEERQFISDNICDKAMNLPFFKRAKLIACYLPSSDEVNCRRLIERAWLMKKRIFVPTVQKNSKLCFAEFTANTETKSNKFGLQEPVGSDVIDPRMLDIVFTPLVAFDEKCNRIGMGGGYYDRAFSFLANRKHMHKPKLVGLAFECQRVEQISASAWDIPLFQVITEIATDL
jgi:5-formyltetrahydrofolate cyclo-ligase